MFIYESVSIKSCTVIKPLMSISSAVIFISVGKGIMLNHIGTQEIRIEIITEWIKGKEQQK